MKPIRTFVAHSSNDQSGQQAKQRRQFIKLMSAGAAGMALQACGGGGAAASAATTQAGPLPPAEGVLPPSTASGSSGPSALVPASTPPVWTTVPTLTFTQGVASTISISKYVKSASGGPLAIALNNIALPPGVTYNARTLSFVYDGIGAVGSTDGHVLTASDI
jgi:hypothetical protein